MKSYIPSLMIGSRVNNYEILRKLAEGGMAEVYLALDTKLNRKVALQFLSDSIVGDQSFLKRFRREAQVIASPKGTGRSVVIDRLEIGQ